MMQAEIAQPTAAQFLPQSLLQPPPARLRIALFSDIYKPRVNGVVNHVALLKQYLSAWGHDVFLFVPGADKHAAEEPNVIRIPGIPIANTGYHLSVRLDRRSREILSHMDVVHVHHPFISGSFGVYCATHYKTPLIFTNHTRYDLIAKAYLPLLPAALSDTAMQAYFQRFSRHCAALIAPSPGIARIMKQWRVQGRIEVIPNGIELDRFYQPQRGVTRQQLNLAPDTVIAIYVGRMSPEKNLERLLQTFQSVAAEAADVHLLLVGDGSELNDLQHLAQRLRIGHRVTFTGGVDYDAVPGYLALADFFVSASVSEVHPLTFIEAAAAGLPALGMRATGVVDIIDDEVSGLIAPDGDGEFRQRFLRLARDADLRGRLGAQARASSHEYAAATNAQRVLALYSETVGRAATPRRTLSNSNSPLAGGVPVSSSTSEK
ncbi:MAG: glycosyltransferase [Litorilinea sp.]